MENLESVTRREFGKSILSSVIFSSLLVSCGGGGKEKGYKTLPEVSVKREFENDGYVKYKIVGIEKNPNDKIAKIRTKYNDEKEQIYNGGSRLLKKPIVKRRNTLATMVINGNGVKSKILIDTLTVPTREAACFHIRKMLKKNNKFESFLSDSERFSVYLENNPIDVNFLIKRKDKRFSVINYISFEDEPNVDHYFSDKEELDNFFIDNLYMYKLPLDEITNYMTEFINAKYLSDFE